MNMQGVFQDNFMTVFVTFYARVIVRSKKVGDNKRIVGGNV